MYKKALSEFISQMKKGERLLCFISETTLAKKAGLELGIKGAIVVNDKMETSVPDIYAVGDAVQVKHTVRRISFL